MKALIKNEEAQAGIGTLIIFIAMVLMAAVAPAVLIHKREVMNAKSTQIPKEASAMVCENLYVKPLVKSPTELILLPLI
jgi:flagellin FlaB